MLDYEDDLQSKGVTMTKMILAATLAVGLLVATADLNQAQAQFGYGFRPVGCAPRVPVYTAGYGYHRAFSPYGTAYRGYYGAPGLTVSRTSYYAAPGIRTFSSPYGLGGFGNLGYPGLRIPARTAPRVQLRVGF